MQINLKGTKIKLTKAIKDYVQEKMDMMEKYLGKIPVINCKVEVGMVVGGQNNGDIYFTEINLSVPHELLRIEKNSNDLYKSIDKAKDHMVRSIEKYKEKKIDKKRKIVEM
jgi:ribosomal subunit interface protein